MMPDTSGHKSVKNTAVTTPFVLFEFLSMPFELRNADETFQKFMDNMKRDLNFVYFYIDNLIVVSPNVDEHIQHLTPLSQSLSDNRTVVEPT